MRYSEEYVACKIADLYSRRLPAIRMNCPPQIFSKLLEDLRNNPKSIYEKFNGTFEIFPEDFLHKIFLVKYNELVENAERNEQMKRIFISACRHLTADEAYQGYSNIY